MVIDSLCFYSVFIDGTNIFTVSMMSFLLGLKWRDDCGVERSSRRSAAHTRASTSAAMLLLSSAEARHDRNTASLTLHAG